MKTAKVNPAELILNYDIYPRHKINGENVTHIKNAREAGVELPPVVAWKKNKFIIDGFHRVTDALRAKLDSIEVEWRDYPNEAAALEDAIRMNMHGIGLASYDRARCIQLAERFELSRDRLGMALGLTLAKLGELEDRKIAVDPEIGPRPIKLTAVHLAGQQLTHKQSAGIDKATGMRGLTYINQVINLLEADLIDRKDKQQLQGLRILHKLIGRYFAHRKVKAIA